MSRVNLGPVTAYAIAKKNGFEGTEQEWLESLVGDGLKDKLEELKSIVKGAQQAISFDSYETMINAFNTMPIDKYNAGQNVNIVTLNVPDLWISYITETNIPYTYTTDQAFVDELLASGSVQVGNYKFSQLEMGKVELTDYVKNTDLVKFNVPNKAGLVIVDSSFQDTYGGVTVSSIKNGYLVIRKASYSSIDKRSPSDYIDGGTSGANNCYPIVPANIDYAVKAVLTDSKLSWTDEEKAKARELLGIE